MGATDNPKYRQIVKTASRLFIRHGVRRVTVEEICKTAGVSKMTFYKFFENKIALVKQILMEMSEEVDRFTDDLMSRDIPFQEKATQNVQHKIEKIGAYGDLFFDELAESAELQPFMIEMNRNRIDKILMHFRQGKQEGAIRENIGTEFYQYMLEQIQRMSKDEKLKQLLPDLRERVESLINVLFFGIFTK